MLFAKPAAKTLKSVTIPNSIEVIEKGAFQACRVLENITFANESNLVEIGDYAFYLTNITSITIPEGVKTIGKYAFSFCTNLTTINLPSTLQTLGSNTLDSNYAGECLTVVTIFLQ